MKVGLLFVCGPVLVHARGDVVAIGIVACVRLLRAASNRCTGCDQMDRRDLGHGTAHLVSMARIVIQPFFSPY